MSDGRTRYCKFCGERVEYIVDFNDYYCRFCHSYQTHSESIKAGGKSSPKYSIDPSPPPETPPILPSAWQSNIPMFRHKEYLVMQAFLSWGPKYDIYNVTGHKMGEIKGKIITWGGEWTYFDLGGNQVAKVKGNPTLLKVQEKRFNIRDHQGNFRGAIKSKFGFLKRHWELYDHRGSLIGQPNEQIWLKTNFQLVDQNGRIMLNVDKKWFTFRDQFRVIVSETIDPLIALAYAVAVDYMYWQGDRSSSRGWF